MKNIILSIMLVLALTSCTAKITEPTKDNIEKWLQQENIEIPSDDIEEAKNMAIWAIELAKEKGLHAKHALSNLEYADFIDEVVEKSKIKVEQ